MEVGAACAAAGAAGLHLAGYNRANYFENLSLKQSRNFRKQQIVGSQADLFRADVEQAIGASSAVQDRLIVVSALLLGVTAHTNGWRLNVSTRDFLNDIFYLCIGNAFLYFLVSLIASISANILARKCQKELLNNCVRPPFAEMMRDVDLAAELESAEAFERQGVSQVFRIPGADNFGSPKEKLLAREDEASASMESLIQQQISNELTLMEMQSDWDELQTYTPYFIVWGLRSLLNGFGFFALAHTYNAQKPYGFQVHTFYVVVVVGLSFISERLMATSFKVFTLELVSMLACHVICFYVAWQDRQNRGSRPDGSTIALIAFAAQLVTVAIAHFRFGANALERRPRGPSRVEIKPEIADGKRSCCFLEREDSVDSEHSFARQSHHSFSSDDLEWSMAPELLTTFSRAEREETFSQSILSQKWANLSFVRIYVRKFCLFAGWAVIAVWLLMCVCQTLQSFVAPTWLDEHAGRHLEEVVTVTVKQAGGVEQLRSKGSKTVGELMEELPGLSLWQRLQGKRLAALEDGIELSPQLPLSSVAQLSVEIKDPWWPG